MKDINRLENNFDKDWLILIMLIVLPPAFILALFWWIAVDSQIVAIYTIAFAIVLCLFALMLEAFLKPMAVSIEDRGLLFHYRLRSFRYIPYDSIIEIIPRVGYKIGPLQLSDGKILHISTEPFVKLNKDDITQQKPVRRGDILVSYDVSIALKGEWERKRECSSSSNSPNLVASLLDKFILS